MPACSGSVVQHDVLGSNPQKEEQKERIEGKGGQGEMKEGRMERMRSVNTARLVFPL